MKRFLNSVIAPFFGFLWIYLVSITLKVRFLGKEQMDFCQNNRHILAFWHSRIFYMPFHFRKSMNYFILVSPSTDGEIINGILRYFGFQTVRGSTFKHGRRALISLARAVKKGGNAAMIADGSRGPARKAQLGSLYLAKLTGVPVIPIAFGPERKWELNSWDRTILPKPFSRLTMVFGTPVYIPPDCGEDEMERKRIQIEIDLNDVTDRADGLR